MVHAKLGAPESVVVVKGKCDKTSSMGKINIYLLSMFPFPIRIHSMREVFDLNAHLKGLKRASLNPGNVKQSHL